MAIIIREDNIFVLETKNTHYVFGIDQRGYNRHIHWGRKASPEDYFTELFGDENSNHSMLDACKQELTVYGGTLYRDCSIKAVFGDGCSDLKIRYTGYEVKDNYLRVDFSDEYYPLAISLHYLIEDDSDIISKHISVKNNGSDTVAFERLFSAEFTLPGQQPYKFINTNGAWGAEFLTCESTLEGGAQVFESRRGTTGHNQAPWFIAHRNADEDKGDVFFAVFAHSGNFKVSASRDLFGVSRVNMGLNDFDFLYELRPGEEFTTPAVYGGYTQGFGDMSRQMGRYCVKNVMPSSFAKKPLPVLYNSWEATWFSVSTEGQSKLAEIAADIGVELFVMDDGWFGHRPDDRSGLGDWFVNKEKFPKGLHELIEKVNSLGMDFGLWFEPEMVSPDSDLYRQHPDWVYHYKTRQGSLLRHQLVLNMTKPEVQQYIKDRLDTMLTEYNIKYIKWDMNRPFSEAGAENLSCRKMLWYLHTKAVYDIVDFLKTKHPDVAIESCSSGGGRSDWGALSHFDQVWTSDNTDSIDRLVIQKGYSLLHPVKAMRAWVTDGNKPVSLDFKFNVAMQGSLGIGGNLIRYSEEDLDCCRKNIAEYKAIRELVQFGELYRLLDIDRCEVSANQYVNCDKTESIIFIAANGTRFFKKNITLFPRGLDENKRYSLTIGSRVYEKSGAYFMNVGIDIGVRGAYYNRILKIKEI